MLIPVIVMLGAGCAGTGSSRVTGVTPAVRPAASAAPADRPEDTLRRRAEKFWKARVAEDFASLYDYQEPEVQATTTKDEFVAQSREDPGVFKYYSWDLGRAEVHENIGWIEVRAVGRVVRFPDTPRQNLNRWDTWQLIDGEWYPVMGEARGNMPEPPSKRNAEEEGWLSKRFQEYWEARRTANYPILYEYLNPADRQAIKYDHFAETEAWFKFLDCRVAWTEVIGERGRVGIYYTARTSDPHLSKTAPVTKFIVESWVKSDGLWFRDVEAPPVKPKPEDAASEKASKT
jgi:hypothetical protein